MRTDECRRIFGDGARQNFGYLLLRGMVMEFKWPVIEFRWQPWIRYNETQAVRIQAVRPGFRNSFGRGRVGVKVVCGFPGGGWDLPILII